MHVENRSSPPALWGVWFSSTLSTLLPAHQHTCPELNVIMAGSVRYRVQGTGELIAAQAGQMLILPQGVNHELVYASEDVALWVVELNGVCSYPWLEHAQVINLELGSRKTIVSGARSLWLRPARLEAYALQSKLWDVLGALSDSTPAVQPEPVHPAVERAKHVCESQVHRALDIDHLSRACGLSSSRLAHVFSDQMGITPLQYRNFVRVQQFIVTYKDDERNLLRAALQFGFGSYAQFHRTFRQVCGSSPAEHFRWLAESERVDAQTTLRATALPSVVSKTTVVEALRSIPATTA
jgi:AraC-like DNA-binding protein